MKYKTLIKRESLRQQNFPSTYSEAMAGSVFWSDLFIEQSCLDQQEKLINAREINQKNRELKHDLLTTSSIKKEETIRDVQFCQKCSSYCLQPMLGGIQEKAQQPIKVMFMFDQIYNDDLFDPVHSDLKRERKAVHAEVMTDQKRQMVLKMAQAMNLERKDFLLSSLTKCPISNDEFWEKTMMECQEWVRKEIDELQPKVIVAFGARVTKSLLGKEEKISLVHGKFFSLSSDYLKNDNNKNRLGINDVKVLPTFHLDYIMLNESMKRTAWEDLKQVMSYLNVEGVESDT
jgi:uracil-DNA glycosylase family 4